MNGAAGVGLLVVSLLLSGCGQSPGGSVAAAPRAHEDVRHELQRLYDLTWGPPASRQALEVLAYTEFQEKVADCLHQLGAGYTPGVFFDATAAERPTLDWFDVLPPVEEKLVARQGFGPSAVMGGEVAPGKNWPGRQATDAEQGYCEGQAPRPDYIDAVAPALDEELYELVGAKVWASPAASGMAYKKCIQAAGYTATDRSELAGSFMGKRSKVGRAGPAEQDAAAADARCRRPAHKEVMDALDGPLRVFASTHAAQLERLADRASDLQAQAKLAAQRMDLPVSWL